MNTVYTVHIYIDRQIFKYEIYNKTRSAPEVSIKASVRQSVLSNNKNKVSVSGAMFGQGLQYRLIWWNAHDKVWPYTYTVNFKKPICTTLNLHWLTYNFINCKKDLQLTPNERWKNELNCWYWCMPSKKRTNFTVFL